MRLLIRNRIGRKANPQMSTEFPQLCKWNGFTIDSPMTRWEYGGEAMGKFLPLCQRARVKLEDERSGGSLGNCRWPVPHSANG